MDADWIDSPRETLLSRREKRWSMNSQRLETILAQLLKPISTDNRRSFDTDQSALLEEYLTEAGLRVLEAAEDEQSARLEFELPNFVEIALVLQQSVANYSRKVDCLYEDVVQVCVSIHNCTNEASNNSSNDEPQTPTTVRRKRKASAAIVSDFAEIDLDICEAATRESEGGRAPPTLARTYVELEPRVAGGPDMPLYDYAGEHIGLLTDFTVTWRLHDGMLVDELEGGGACGGGYRRGAQLSLVEVREALEARAPPPPPRRTSLASQRSCSPAPVPPPLHQSTPLPSPSPCLPPPPPAKCALHRDRKRYSAVNIDDIFTDPLNIAITKEMKSKLRKVQEFAIDKMWIETVVKKRKSNILSERKRLLQETPPDLAFPGWSVKEASLAHEATLALREACADFDSDDDGFFEQSGDDDDVMGVPRRHVPPQPPLPQDNLADSGLPDSPPVAPPALDLKLGPTGPLDPDTAERAAALAAWRADVLRRAAESEARGAPDVRTLAERVLNALEGAEECPRPFDKVLRGEAKHHTDVSRLMLAALFLANSGNVEIESGPALALNSFSVRLKSRDTSRYAQAAEAAVDLFS